MRSLASILVVAALLFAGCGKPPAETTFAAAQEALRQAQAQADTMKDRSLLPKLFEPVLDKFEQVQADHPHTELGATSLFMVGTILNNNTAQPSLAADAYKRYLQDYPEGKQAPLAMFLVGYLYNNELHNTDSARVAYERFLAKFPNDEMALSARYELSNLGKTPDELLPPPDTAQPPPPKKSRVAAKK